MYNDGISVSVLIWEYECMEIRLCWIQEVASEDCVLQSFVSRPMFPNQGFHILNLDLIYLGNFRVPFC